MSLIYSEKMDLFQRFKDKDIDKLRKLSVTFKAHKNYEKAQLADLLIKVKSQDIKGLKALQKELSRSGALMEAAYADSLLKEKLTIKSGEEKRTKEQRLKAKLEKMEEAKKSESATSESSLGLSEEVCNAMAKRIELNSQRHRDRIKGMQSDKNDEI